MDFIKIKKIIIFALALPALYLIASNMSLIFNRPDIKNLNVPNMADISFNSNSKELIVIQRLSIIFLLLIISLSGIDLVKMIHL